MTPARYEFSDMIECPYRILHVWNRPRKRPASTSSMWMAAPGLRGSGGTHRLSADQGADEDAQGLQHPFYCPRQQDRRLGFDRVRIVSELFHSGGAIDGMRQDHIGRSRACTRS